MKLELECYDENTVFGLDMLASNPLLGTATVDLNSPSPSPSPSP